MRKSEAMSPQGEGQKYYFEIRIAARPEIAELINLSLFEMGAQGIVEEDEFVIAYFSDLFSENDLVREISETLKHLGEVAGMTFPINVAARRCEERDWNAEWKKGWRPLRVSDGIMIKPSWLDAPADAPPIIIEMDPEMAFGSGDHSTTQLVLRLIEKNIRKNNRLLDVGTGTGILSIAALKLGGASVIAFDVDPIASQTAKKNAAVNQVQDGFHVFTGVLEAIRPTEFDLIAANVNRSQILLMLPGMSRLLRLRGMCLLSGILESEEDQIRRACEQSGLTILQVVQDKEWLAFETRKE
jgi:ribosomal protein L11 methyltransferase